MLSVSLILVIRMMVDKQAKEMWHGSSKSPFWFVHTTSELIFLKIMFPRIQISLVFNFTAQTQQWQGYENESARHPITSSWKFPKVKF